MFTTLNLTLASQMPAEPGVLQPSDTEGLPILDAETFAASLETSLNGDAEGEIATLAGGSPLPLAGIELPVEEELLPAPGLADAVASDDPGVEVGADWPPGLFPTVTPESGEVDGKPSAEPTSKETVGPGLAPPVDVARTVEKASLPAAAAPVVTPALRETGERRAPNLDRSPVPPPDAPLDIEARPVPERPDRMPPEPAPIRLAPGVQPDVQANQRPPEWSLPTAASTTAVVDNDALSALANGNAVTAQRSSVATTTTLPTITTPVGDPKFGDSVADRVLLMANNRLGNAEIRLTPAELGPVRVQVNVDDGTATLQFHAAHAATRDALEQALPRLRDMLAEHGLSLGQASVGDDGSRQGVRENAGDSGSNGSEDGSDADRTDANTERDAGEDVDRSGAGHARHLANALVDTFA